LGVGARLAGYRVHAGKYCTKEKLSAWIVIVYLAWYAAYLGMNEFEALVGCCLADMRVNMAYEREINRCKGDNIPEQGGSGGISPKLKDDILNLSGVGDVSAHPAGHQERPFKIRSRAFEEEIWHTCVQENANRGAISNAIGVDLLDAINATSRF
jgi:hypothetical protein